MKVILIGLGVMGRRHHTTLTRNEAVEEVVTVDPNPQLSAQYLSAPAALKGHKFDFGVIASPTSFHEESASFLLDAGLSILIEKPVAKTVTAAQRIAARAESNGCKVAVGHIERFNPAIVALMEDLSESPRAVTLKRVSPYPQRITDVGVALDRSIHDVDLVRYITGAEVISSKAVLQNNRNKCEDTAMYLLELDNGGSGLIHTSWMSPRQQRSAEVTTSEAVYDVDMLRQQTVKYTNVPEAGHGVTSLFINRDDQLAAQLKSFIEYVRTGDRGNLCLLKDGTRALAIVEASLNERLH